MYHSFSSREGSRRRGGLVLRIPGSPSPTLPIDKGAGCREASWTLYSGPCSRLAGGGRSHNMRGRRQVATAATGGSGGVVPES